MNIIKAVKKARSTQKGITRLEWMPEATILIPTNTISCFILVPFADVHVLGRRWNPSAEDILAKDWIVTK